MLSNGQLFLTIYYGLLTHIVIFDDLKHPWKTITNSYTSLSQLQAANCYWFSMAASDREKSLPCGPRFWNMFSIKFSRGKKILEQLSRPRFFPGFKISRPFFPTCLTRRKEREISKAGKHPGLDMCSNIFFPSSSAVSVRFFRGIQKSFPRKRTTTTTTTNKPFLRPRQWSLPVKNHFLVWN